MNSAADMGDMYVHRSRYSYYSCFFTNYHGLSTWRKEMAACIKEDVLGDQMEPYFC